MVTDSKKRAGAESLSREEMLERARDLVPLLEERAARGEELRQCPPETVQDFSESGLLVAGNPPRYGGYDTDYDVTHDILIELGRGDGGKPGATRSGLSSIGLWGTSLKGHKKSTSLLARQLCVRAPSTRPRARPHRCRVAIVSRVTGDFSSRCDAASWFMPGAMGPEGPLWLMLPKGDYEIVDLVRVGPRRFRQERHRRAGRLCAGIQDPEPEQGRRDRYDGMGDSRGAAHLG